MERLIGIPYKWRGSSYDGVDCWGLCQLYYKMVGRRLPDILELYLEKKECLSMGHVKENIRHKFSKVEEPVKGDICLFNIQGLPVHVGIYIDKLTFLHSTEGSTSSICRFTDPKYKTKLDSFWRTI